MTDDDPVPLKAGGEASPELVRALYALGKRGAADAARLERVAKRLEAALGDAPPPGAATNGAKLLGTKTLITGIVIGVAALSWLGYQIARRATSDESRPTRAPESSQVVVPEPAPSPVVTASEPAVLPQVAAESPAVRERVSLPTAASSRRTSVRHGGSNRGPSASTSSSASSASATPADAVAVQAAPAPSAELAARAAAEEDVAAKPKPADRKLTTREAPEKPAAAPQRSEVGLLFEARKTMPDDPLAALRLLEEHAQRFPAGMLGPEREVLRIEALRKLGRTAEATERMRAFEARYPNSIHLRRLQERSDSKP